MLTIKKIYMEPNEIDGFVFDPILLEKGMNIILGERSNNDSNSPERNKMNGVGKSVLIEIIDYCFLNDLKSSRLQYIPLNLVYDRTYFCMDFEVVDGDGVAQSVTIKRDRLNKGNFVIFVVDDEEIRFEKLEDAKTYMERFIIIDRDSDSPRLRSIISILLRDEKTQYGDIFFTDSDSKRYNYSDLIKPHLYLFGAKLDIIADIRRLLLQRKNIKKIISQVNSDFRTINISADEVKAHINDLQDRLDKLDRAIQQLAPAEASIQKKEEIAMLLSRLDSLTSQRAAKEYLLEKIKSLPKAKEINTKQLSAVYNSYKKGLGDLVGRSFEDILVFRREIEKFQEDLIINKQKEIRSRLNVINDEIKIVDSQLSKLYKSSEIAEKIDDIAEAVAQQKTKDRELSELSMMYKLYNDSTVKKQEVVKELNKLFDELEVQVFSLNNTVESFNSDLSEIHEAIAGNKRCQFELKINPKSEEYLLANYRIKLDGSMGINHIKTFIYDVLLMTNKKTSLRHPGFLIHDNIFAGTGRDDMVKALNYLVDLERSHGDFQYIVTINKDEFESNQEDFTFNVVSKVRKTLTRAVPLFGKVYDEIK